MSITPEGCPTEKERKIMSILSFIKGKLKQREVRKLEPDNNFEFEENYYGDIDILEGFNFVYCNNYTEKLYSDKTVSTNILSFISCVISLPAELKVIKDLEFFINHTHNESTFFNYDNINIKIDKEKIQLLLRGDITFYTCICKKIHNNIFTKYIRNNILLEDIPLETPNEYLNNMYNSINNPSKDVDILFIEDNIVSDDFKPVIGLSIRDKQQLKYPIETSITGRNTITLNNRKIMYITLDKLDNEEISYLVENVRHGDKLIKLLHKYITNNDYSDIDEIIEE